MSLDVLVSGECKKRSVIFVGGLWSPPEETIESVPKAIKDMSKVIVPRLTGHNGVPFNPTEDLGILESIIKKYALKNNGEKVYVAGWSYGADRLGIALAKMRNGYARQANATEFNPDGVLFFSPVPSIKYSIGAIMPKQYALLTKMFVNLNILHFLDGPFMRKFTNEDGNGNYIFKNLTINLNSLKEVRKSESLIKYATDLHNLKVLIVHGTNDRTCRYENSKTLYSRIKSKVKTLALLPQAGHNVFEYKGIADKIMPWIEKIEKHIPYSYAYSNK